MDKNKEKALHYSTGKLGIGQIPEEILALVGLVYSYGEVKYDRDNWKNGTDWHEFYESTRRHMLSWWLHEDDDPESGLPHLAHAIWNLITLAYYEVYGLGTDDRPAILDGTSTLRGMLRETQERARMFKQNGAA